MESSDSNNKDSHSIRYTCGALYRNLNLKTGTVDGEADMETVSCAFSLLCI